MANLLRRERKEKNADAIMDENMRALAEFTSDVDLYPEIIEKMEDSSLLMRLAAIRTLSNIPFSDKYKEFIEDNIDDILTPLREIILGSTDKTEHDEALNLLCHISLILLQSMDIIASPIVKGLLARLSCCEEHEAFRFFAIAFIVVFGMTDDQLKQDTFSQIAELYLDKHKRSSEFSEEIKSEALQSLALLASSIPSDVFCSEHLQTAETIVDRALQSSKVPIITSCLPLVNIILCNVIEMESNSLDQTETNRVTSKYSSKIDSAISKIIKKSDAKMVEQKVEEINESLNGEIPEIHIKLNSQEVTFSGGRTITLVDAIRRVCKTGFQKVMEDNVPLQEMFGFKLMSSQRFMRIEKKQKKIIKEQRVENTKMRQQQLSKQRDNKAPISED